MLTGIQKRKPATARQYVSLCIWVFVVSGVFVLNYLSNEQWLVTAYTTPEDNGNEAITAQSNFLEEKGDTFIEKTSTEAKAALSWQDLGRSSYVESMINPTEKLEQHAEIDEEIRRRISALLKSRNPCWQDSKSRSGLACLPSFYLAGFPKCGTTDLYQRMSAHPDIAATPMKELHWITRGRFESNKSLHRYEEFFGETLLRYLPVHKNWSSVIVGDHSSTTLWDNSQWQQLPGNANCSKPRIITADVVRHLNRDAKIVVIVRNPADRLYSEYMFFSANTSKQAFHSHVVRDTQRAKDCFKRHSVRWCVYNVLQEMTLRLHVGLYTVYVEDWLKRFPRDQFHVLRLEDMARNPHDEVTVVHKFLDLGEAKDETTVEKVRSPEVANPGYRSQMAGPMWPETRRILDDFYRPFNSKLAYVLQDEKYLWTDV